MLASVLLTGATGALGQALLPELLERGYEVHCLIRPQRGKPAAARLRDLTTHPRAIALDGDITEPLGGVDPSKLPAISKLIHAAADTSLNQGNEARVIDSNLIGTTHALDLAEALGRPDFYYFGTAYIAGDAPVLAEQDVGEPLVVGNARNPYEASKVKAENMSRAYAGNFSVLRPSIVVGRSDNGSAPGLEGIYSFFRNIAKLKATVHGGNYLDEVGVKIGKSYKMQIPIGIKDQDNVDLNLIQLDWISRTEAALIGLPARGRTYNLTHPTSMTLKDIIYTTIEAMDLSNITIVDDTGGFTLSPVKLAIRRVIKRELEHLRPYLLHSPQFESRALYEDLGPGWPEPPAITTDFIRMTMKAAEKSWNEPALAAAP